MKSALLRIITNQSAFPSLTEISLTGHSNISGTNGAGKTSSLVLVPVFYGIDPQYMVREKPKTFLDFYLSKARSFVIFEYQRQVRISVCPASCFGIVRPSDLLFVTPHFLTYFRRFSQTFFPLRFAC